MFSLSALSSNQPTLEDVPNSGLINLSLSKRQPKKGQPDPSAYFWFNFYGFAVRKAQHKPLGSARLHSKPGFRSR
jgi:hypothetical protein